MKNNYLDLRHFLLINIFSNIFFIFIFTSGYKYLAADLKKGQSFFNEKKYYKAIETLENNLNLKPYDTKTIQLLQKAYTKIGKYKQAENYLKKLIKLENEVITHKYNLAKLYFMTKKYQPSERELLRILSKNPNHTDSMWLLGEISITNGKYFEAEEYYKKVLSINKTHIQTLLSYYRLLIIDFDYGPRIKEADQIIETLKETHPEDYRTYLTLSEHYRSKKQYQKSISNLQIARKLSNDNLKIKLQFLHTYLMMKNYPEAFIMINKLLKEEPKNHFAIYNSGILKQNLNNLNTAIALFESAYRKSPYSIVYRPKIELFLLNEFTKTKNLFINPDKGSTSINSLDSIIKKNLPLEKLRLKMTKKYYDQGNLFHKNNILKKSLYNFRFAIKLDKSNINLREKLAYIYRDTNQHQKYKKILNFLARYAQKKKKYKILLYYHEKTIQKLIPAKEKISPEKYARKHIHIRNVNTFNSPYLEFDKLFKGYLIEVSEVVLKNSGFLLSNAEQNRKNYIVDSELIYRDKGFDILIILKDKLGKPLKKIYKRMEENQSLFNVCWKITESLTSEMPIQGKILKLNRPNTIVINRGSDQRLKLNDIMEIYKSPNRTYSPFDNKRKSKKIGEVKIIALNENIAIGKVSKILAIKNMRPGDLAIKGSTFSLTSSADKTKKNSPQNSLIEIRNNLGDILKKFGWTLIFPLAIIGVFVIRRVGKNRYSS